MLDNTLSQNVIKFKLAKYVGRRAETRLHLRPYLYNIYMNIHKD